MNEAKCHFCGASFRNRQAVRAHLRHCALYRARRAKPGSAQARLPMRSVPLGRPVPQADEPEVGLDRFDVPPPRVPETKRRPPDTGLTELHALLAADQKRRQEAAAEVRRQRCRQLIERVKERVVGHWSSPRYTIPAETQAQALREIERELSAALAVDDRPEWELVRLAEGLREKLYGPVMRAQDEAQRQEEQRRREAQEEARRADQRIREARERQEAEDRVSALIQYGTDFASAALREVEAHVRQSLLDRVESDLKDRLTGRESKRDVQGLVDTILDEELGEVNENEGDDDEDDDDEYVDDDDDYEDADDD